MSLTNVGTGKHSIFNVPPFPDITSTEKKLSSDYLDRILKRESFTPEVAQMIRFMQEIRTTWQTNFVDG